MNSTLATRTMLVDINICMKRRVVLTLEATDERKSVSVVIETLFDFDAITHRPCPDNPFYRLMELIGEGTCRRILATQVNLPDGPVAPYRFVIEDEAAQEELIELINTGRFEVLGTYSALAHFA